MSLDTLPNEILIGLYESLPNVADILRLSQVSRSFHATSLNLVRAGDVKYGLFPKYENALRLARLQCLADKDNYDVFRQHLRENREYADKGLARAGAWFTNFDTVVPRTATPKAVRALLPVEKERILTSWYSIKLYHDSMMHVFGSNTRQVNRQLEHMNCIQYYVIFSMMRNLRHYGQDLYLQLAIKGDSWNDGPMFDRYISKWHDAMISILHAHCPNEDRLRNDWCEKYLNGPCDRDLPGPMIRTAVLEYFGDS